MIFAAVAGGSSPQSSSINLSVAERFVRVDQQKREQRALLAAADRDLPPVVADLERTEDVEIHLPRS